MNKRRMISFYESSFVICSPSGRQEKEENLFVRVGAYFQNITLLCCKMKVNELILEEIHCELRVLKGWERR